MKQTLFVIQELVAREMKRKYSRSKLGILWSVLNPLLSMTVLSLVFSTMFRKSIENYPVYYLTGFLIWSFFTTAHKTSAVSCPAWSRRQSAPSSPAPSSRACRDKPGAPQHVRPRLRVSACRFFLASPPAAPHSSDSRKRSSLARRSSCAPKAST